MSKRDSFGCTNSFCLRKALIITMIVFLGGCLGMPKLVHPVSDFDLPRYLGKWHEIARLDHSFERGLQQVTAEYSLNQDGSIKVINRGFSSIENKWKEAVGKAYFVKNASDGYLKVSFFGPFYGSYIIFELDKENYQYAFVSGPNEDYLWLLAKTASVKPEIIDQFIATSKARGFDTSKLIFLADPLSMPDKKNLQN